MLITLSLIYPYEQIVSYYPPFFVLGSCILLFFLGQNQLKKDSITISKKVIGLRYVYSRKKRKESHASDSYRRKKYFENYSLLTLFKPSIKFPGV